MEKITEICPPRTKRGRIISWFWGLIPETRGLPASSVTFHNPAGKNKEKSPNPRRCRQVLGGLRSLMKVYSVQDRWTEGSFRLQQQNRKPVEVLDTADRKTEEELKELEKKIGKVPKFFKELTEKEPKMFELVMKFEGHVWDDGALTRKTKKLIAIAIAAALRDQHAVHAPAGRSKEPRRHQGGN